MAERIYLAPPPPKTDHLFYKQSITTSETVLTVTGMEKIVFLSNDDLSNSVFVSFDTVPASSTIGGGLNSVIELAAGETLNDFPRGISSIRLIRSVGSGNVRILGV
jgi:hypothetical protein